MYIITTRRITSGELLKQRNGFCIHRGYGPPLPASSSFSLTMPTGHTFTHSTSLESCGPIFVADQLALQEGFRVDEILRTTQLMIVWNTSS